MNWWCHSCGKRVQAHENSETDEVDCDECGGCFVEEIEEDGEDELSRFVPERQSSQIRNGDAVPPPPPGANTHTNANHDSGAVLNHIFQALTGQTANLPQQQGQVRWMQLGGVGNGGFQQMGVGGTMGDYAFGNISAVVNRLMQSEDQQGHAPAASRAVVAELPEVVVDEGLAAGEGCAVCKDSFELGQTVKRLPCEHVFHPPCILPWLEKNNTCPVCRFQLPTDDPEYEQRRASIGNSA